MKINWPRQLIFTARNEVGARLYFHRRLSFCSQWGGVLLQCMLGYPPVMETPWQGDPLARRPPGKEISHLRRPPGKETPLRSACWEIQSTSGRYASYWNAILLFSGNSGEDWPNISRRPPLGLVP